jgi:anti-anti-sigma regulatory factor
MLVVSTTWQVQNPSFAADDAVGRDDRAVLVLRQLRSKDELPELRWRLRDAVLGGARTVVVDAAGVPDLSSGMISALLTTHRLCRLRGGRVELLNCERGVIELLERTSLWRVFGCGTSPRAGLGSALPARTGLSSHVTSPRSGED